MAMEHATEREGMKADIASIASGVKDMKESLLSSPMRAPQELPTHPSQLNAGAEVELQKAQNELERLRSELQESHAKRLVEKEASEEREMAEYVRRMEAETARMELERRRREEERREVEEKATLIREAALVDARRIYEAASIEVGMISYSLKRPHP